MKNVLIVALLIGLAVSLWFNWKGFGKPVNNDTFRSIELGKDSLVVTYYYEKLAEPQFADSLNSSVSQIKGQTNPSDDNLKNRTLFMYSQVIGTSKGCEDCNYDENDKSQTKECINISCVPIDLSKFQVIVNGPEHIPGPEYRLFTINSYLKRR